MIHPIDRFKEAIELAGNLDNDDPTAMTLATCTSTGKPSARIVLLKSVDHRGFVFFTNYQSRKSHELDENPFASICFYWPVLIQQFRAEGRIERVTPAESDEYFATRPRDSQIGAWASKQSERLSSRSILEERVRQYEAEYSGKEVPRPPHWGGFRLIPETMEFWYGRPNRLHERIVYVRNKEKWDEHIVYP